MSSLLLRVTINSKQQIKHICANELHNVGQMFAHVGGTYPLYSDQFWGCC